MVGATIATNWRQEGYLEQREIPKDPWGNDFVYVIPGNHGAFDLTSFGADGKPGGEDFDKDINNWELADSSLKCNRVMTRV